MDLNPYQSPQVLEAADDLPPGDGLWRDREFLVTLPSAQLPARCVKTNAPTAPDMDLQINWFPDWTMTGIFLGPVIVLLMYRGCVKVHLRYALCAECQRERKRKAVIATIVGVAIIVVAAALAILYPAFGGGCLLIGFVADGILFALMLGSRRVLTVMNVRGKHIWVVGASEAFLAELPPWPQPGRAAA